MQRGRKPARLVRSSLGWYIRYDWSGPLDREIILHNDGSLSKEEVIEWGTQWANVDPINREFFAATADLS